MLNFCPAEGGVGPEGLRVLYPPSWSEVAAAGFQRHFAPPEGAYRGGWGGWYGGVLARGSGGGVQDDALQKEKQTEQKTDEPGLCVWFVCCFCSVFVFLGWERLNP